MNYKETLNKGLKRGYEFTVAADVYNKSLDAKIEEIKKTIKVDGFRPGKVPNNIIMQKHGEAINAFSVYFSLSTQVSSSFISVCKFKNQSYRRHLAGTSSVCRAGS